MRRLVRERHPRWVVLQCEAITDIDVTAADMLDRLDTELNAQGIHMAFVELRTRLHDLVYRYGLFETLDRDHFYSSIDDALLAIGSEEAGESTSSARMRSGGGVSRPRPTPGSDPDRAGAGDRRPGRSCAAAELRARTCGPRPTKLTGAASDGDGWPR